MALEIEFRGGRCRFTFIIMWLVSQHSKMTSESVLTPTVCMQDFRTPLMEAAILDNYKLAELLIMAGADVNAVDLVSKRCADVPVTCLSRFMK